jgi:hypothetical protein
VRHQRSWQQCEPTTQGCWPQHHSHHKPNLVVAKDSNERKGIHFLLLSLCRVFSRRRVLRSGLGYLSSWLVSNCTE